MEVDQGPTLPAEAALPFPRPHSSMTSTDKHDASAVHSHKMLAICEKVDSAKQNLAKGQELDAEKEKVKSRYTLRKMPSRA